MILHRILILTTASLALSSCKAEADKPQGTPADQSPNTPPQSEAASGPTQDSYSDAEADDYFPKRKVVRHLVDGKVEREIRCLDEQNRLIAVEIDKAGVLLERTEYYPSGTKFAHVVFDADGKGTGTKTVWFENGNKRTEVTLKNGVPHGKAANYYMKGSKKSEWVFVNGIAEGEERRYSLRGELVEIATLRGGQEVSTEAGFVMKNLSSLGVSVRDDVSESMLANTDEEALSWNLKDYWQSTKSNAAPKNPLIGKWQMGTNTLELCPIGLFKLNGTLNGKWVIERDRIIVTQPNGVEIPRAIVKRGKNDEVTLEPAAGSGLEGPVRKMED